MASTVSIIDSPQLGKPRVSQSLADARPLLLRLIESFGSNAVARLLDVRPATVSNWKQHKRLIDGVHARRVVDLHYILTRAFQTFQPDTAMRWLGSNDPFLEGHRPIDILVLQGPARLIEAIDAHEAGAYA
jgi:uncharacterized protein (DUF2384 family)